MKNLLAITFFSFIVFSCRAQEKERVNQFNTLASEAFFGKYSTSAELSKLGKRDLCILEKTIKNHLDDLNDWSMSIVDSFYIRSYYSSDLNDQFAFVVAERSKKVYFIFTPDYHDYLFNGRYAETSDAKKKNKDLVGSQIIKLNTSILDVFLNSEVTESKALTDQIKQVDHLLPRLFDKLLTQRVHTFVLKDSLAKKNKAQYSEIMKILTPLFSSNEINTPWGESFQVYRNELGFTFVHFKKNEENSDKLEIDFYFIPDTFRYTFLRDIDVSRFIDCLK